MSAEKLFMEKLFNEFIDILCNFTVIIINDGEITSDGMKLREFIHLQGTIEECLELVEACLPLMNGEKQFIQYNDFSSGMWVIVKK